MWAIPCCCAGRTRWSTPARWFSIGEGRVEFTVSEGLPSTAEPRCEVTLYAAYPKQGKLEEIIRHGVELGAARVIPFFSRYCVAAPKKEDAKNER